MDKNKFNTLDEDLKLKKVCKVCHELKKVADLQFSFIKKHKKNKNVIKDVFHHYLYVSIENFWDKIDFFFSLRKNKYRKHNGLIIRSIMEQLLQLCYFTLVSIQEKNKIVFQEMTRINKRFYDRDLHKNRNPAEWQVRHEKNIKIFCKDINGCGFPNDLSKVTEIQIKPFPQMEKLCKLAKNIFPKSDIDDWYDDYRYFCEEEHNGLIINWKKDEKKNYRQNLMYCLTYGRYMIELIDRYYLKEQTKNDVLRLVDAYKHMIYG